MLLVLILLLLADLNKDARVDAIGCEDDETERIRFRRYYRYDRLSVVARYSYPTIYSWKDCLKKCKANATCYTFNYLMYYRICELYQASYEESVRRLNLK
jgi:hypothetical protein